MPETETDALARAASCSRYSWYAEEFEGSETTLLGPLADSCSWLPG